ncbi:MAG: hypothetical protein NTX07_05565 [Solirubrobacterales bacterium]|nr:hypothetical protein [Solirubrobacterales bacterium]
MWTITTRGFYSVVAHRTIPEAVLVRGRVREDIEALDDLIPNLEVFEDTAADYRWRAVVQKADWLSALNTMASDVDYDNFKRAVAKEQGSERAQAYADVWSVLYRLQRDA